MKDFTADKTIYTIKDIWEEETYYEASFYSIDDLINYIYEYMRVEEHTVLYDNDYRPLYTVENCMEKTGITWAEWLITNCNYDTMKRFLSHTHYEIIETNILMEKEK